MATATETQNHTSKYSVPALAKGLDILEELADASAPLSLTQLANNLGRSSNEIFRMLSVLENRGYIRRESHSGNYFLSLKLYELAHRHPPIQSLLTAAARPMEKFAEEMNESCHLGVLRRGKLVVLKQAPSPARVSLSIDMGGRFSTIYTVSGQLLLAQLPPQELSAFLDADEDYQKLLPQEQELLAARLKDIRRKGYVTAEHESHVGVRDCAVLIGSTELGLTASLAVAALTDVKNPKDIHAILTALQVCAQDITKELGINNEI